MFGKDFNVIIMDQIQAFDYFDGFDLKHDVAMSTHRETINLEKIIIFFL